MTVTLPSAVLARFVQDPKAFFAGSEGRLWFVQNLDPPANSSVIAGHGLGLNGVQETSAPITGAFIGGVTAVKQVTTYNIVTNPAANDTVTFGGKVYTYVAAGPTGDQILIGGAATDTAANTIAKVNTDTATTLCTATNAGALITATANTAGTPFTTATSVPAKIVITTTTANVVGVKAKATIACATGSGILAKTINEIIFNTKIGSKTRDFHVQFVTQSGNDAAAVLTGLKTAFDDSIANGIGSNEAIYRVFTDETTDTPAQIKQAFIDLFDTNASFAIVSGKLEISAGATGANGNNITIMTQVLNSVPDPLFTVSDNGTPQVKNFLFNGGIYDDLQFGINDQVIEIKGSNSKGTLLRIPSESDLTCSVKVTTDNDPEFLARTTQFGAVTYDATRNVFLFNGAGMASNVAVILVSRSKRVNGWDVLYLYSCSLAGQKTINRALRKADGYTLQLLPDADLERAGDPQGIFWTQRKLAA